MSTRRFSWLHFTDLHAGVDEGEWLWPGVEEEVLADLERLYRRVGSIDAIFFTGDLTQRGSVEEYRRFDEVMGTINQKLAQLKSRPTFVAVPGNHDLTRLTKGSAVLDGLRQWSEDADLRTRFWTDVDGDYRQAVRSAFEPWSEWAEHAIDWEQLLNVEREGVLPGDFSGTIQRNDLTIGVLGLNTAALQLAAGDYRGRLSIHARQVSSLVGKLYEWVDRHDVCFVLTHHDPSWFDEDGRQDWNSEIAKPGRFVAHLCGHRHEQVQTISAEGGARTRTMVVGRSLFGLETYGHEGGRQQRLHGFSAGVIEFGDEYTMRLWPRRDEPQQAGHRVIKSDQSVTLESDEGTPAEKIGSPPLGCPAVAQTRDNTAVLAPSGAPAPAIQSLTEYLIPEVQFECKIHTRDFVGRSVELERVKVWAQEVESGYLLISGPPGQGKSALASAVAVSLGAELHMMKSHPDPHRFLPALTAGMAMKAGFDPSLMALQGSIDDLRNGFTNALMRLADSQHGAMVVIDALDEAAGQFANTLTFLPSVLPPRVHIVLTSRPAKPLLERLRVRCPGVQEMTLGAISWDDFRMMLEARTLGDLLQRNGDAELKRSYERTEGNGLLLRRVTDFLVRQHDPKEHPLSNQGVVPSSLEDLFPVVYDEIIGTGGADSRTAHLVQLLAVAQEPMLIVDLVSAMQIAGEQTSLEECRAICRSIAEYLMDADVRVTLWHHGLTRYVQESVLGHDGVLKLHAELGAWCSESPTANYSLRHRIRHLILAGQSSDARRLVGDPEFILTRVQKRSVSALIDDLHLLIGAADGHEKAQLSVLSEALRLSLPILVRHPEMVHQELYNHLYWYDAPEAASHWAERSDGDEKGDNGGKDLSSVWSDAARNSEGIWLRALRPVAGRLGTGQIAAFPTGGHSAAHIIGITADETKVALGLRFGDSWTCMSVVDGTHELREGRVIGWVPKMQHVAVVDSDGIAFLGAHMGDERQRIAWPEGARSEHNGTRSHGRPSFAIDTYGARLCTASTWLTVWDLEAGRKVIDLPAPRGYVWSRPEFDPKSRYIVATKEHRHREPAPLRTHEETCLVDLASGNVQMLCRPFIGAKAAFNADGTMVAVTDIASGVRVFDLTDGLESRRFGGDSRWVEGAAFSPDGSLLATGGHKLRIWNVSTGKVIAQFMEHLGLVRQVEFFPDGRRLVSVGDDEMLRISNIDDSCPATRYIEPKSSVMDIVFSPDGTILATYGLWENALQIWDANQGTLTRTIDGGLRSASSGVSLTWVGDRHVVGADGGGNYSVWDIQRARQVLTHNSKLKRLAEWVPAGVSADGQRIALPLGADWETARVLRISDSKVLLELSKTIGDASQFAWTPDGRWLIAAGTQVAVLDGGTGNLEWEVPDLDDAQFFTVAISPDSLWLCLVGRYVEVWNLEARQRLWHSGLDEDNGLSGSDRLESQRWKRSGDVAEAAGVPVFSSDGSIMVVHYGYSSRFRSIVFATESGRVIERVKGVTDPKALADRRPWRVTGGDIETELIREGDRVIAWGPVMDRIAISPTDNVVAGSQGHRLYLFRVEEKSGHGGGDMIKKSVARTADEYAFVLKELGVTPK